MNFNKEMDNYNKKYDEELNKTGLFWAFDRKQFDENKTNKDAPDNEYATIGDGGYIHKSNLEKFNHFFKVIEPKLKENFVRKIKIEDLIKYELINYEAYLIEDYTLVCIKIKSFYPDMDIKDITKLVKKIYDSNINKAIAEKENIDI